MNKYNAIFLTKEFINFDTFNNKGKLEILNYIKNILDNETVAETKIYNADKDNPFLISNLKTLNPEMTIMLEGHLDVVSPDGMIITPYKAEEKDGMIYGRGSSDMKAGCAVMMAAFIEASKVTKRKGDIYLVFTTDEEYAGYGILEIMEKNLIPKCDFALISEPTDGIIYTAHNGNAWVKVEFYGKSAHASIPELGINAINMAGEFIHKFKLYTNSHYPLQKHEIFGTPKVNIGMISGGTGINIVPANAEIKIDKRYLPGDNINNFLNEIQEVIDECKKEDINFSADYNIIVDCPSVVVERDNEILLRIKKSVDEVWNSPIEYGIMSGWGEGGYINKFGIPVIYFGPGYQKEAHTKDEKCSIEMINKNYEGYMNI